MTHLTSMYFCTTREEKQHQQIVSRIQRASSHCSGAADETPDHHGLYVHRFLENGSVVAGWFETNRQMIALSEETEEVGCIFR